MTIRIDQDPHALAILASLEAGSVAAGDHIAPHDLKPTDAAWTPYVVLYMVPAGDVDGTAGEPDSWGDLRFQLTAVGRLPAEARYTADRADQALADHPPIVEGRSIQRVRRIEASSGIHRDEDLNPPLFYVPTRYGAFTFPT